MEETKKGKSNAFRNVGQGRVSEGESWYRTPLAKRSYGKSEEVFVYMKIEY